jgi:hypothetical protein
MTDMPAYEALPRFTTDLDHLTPKQRGASTTSSCTCSSPAWSINAGPAGRATWEWGPEHRPGEQHIVWRRVGGHDILN